MKTTHVFGELASVDRISPAEEAIARVRSAGARLILADEGDVFVVDWRSSSIRSGSPTAERRLLRHYDGILEILRREAGLR